MNVAAAVSLFTTAVGLVFGVIWWRISRAPGWQHMRWFAAVSVTAAGYSAFDAFAVFDLPSDALQISTRMAFTTSALHAVAWICWLAESQARRLDRLDYTVLALSCIVAVGGLIPGLFVGSELISFKVDWLNVTYHMAQPTTWGVAGYLIFVSALWLVAARSLLRWKQGWRARLPAIAVAVLTIIGAHDTLATAKYIESPMLADLGFLVVILIFGVDSLRRFAEDAERLESLSHRLESLVAERTRQLEVAHLELAKERTVAAVGRLAGGVAHQINSPATVLSVNLGLLQDELAERGGLTRVMADLLSESREALHRILGIVADLRASSGRSDGRRLAHPTTALRGCVDAAVERAAQRGVRVPHTFVNIPPDLHVAGERDLVTQMLTELVMNAGTAALKARPLHARVGIVARPDNGHIELEVRDNGGGVPRTVQAALFEPFVGAHGVAQRRGLGLAVVRGLAEQLGAQLSLAETSEDGTVFRLRLRASALERTAVPVS